MGIFSFIKDIAANARNSQIYGQPSIFLRPVVLDMKELGGNNCKSVIENQGRFKFSILFDSEPVYIDFIYYADYIQTTVIIPSVRFSDVINSDYDARSITNNLKIILNQNNLIK